MREFRPCRHGVKDMAALCTQAIGRNPRFLQGHATDPSARRNMSVAIRSQRGICLHVYNFGNTEGFWNHLHLHHAIPASGASLQAWNASVGRRRQSLFLVPWHAPCVHIRECHMLGRSASILHGFWIQNYFGTS